MSSSSNSDTRCADVRGLLGGYVLHALEPDEADTVRRHLAACPACAAEHGDLTGIPALLDIAGTADITAEQPPATLEEAVLDRFAREHPGHPGHPGPASAADQALEGVGRRSEDRRARARVRARARAVTRTLARPLPAALTGAVAAAAITAVLIVLPGGNTSEPGEQYQATLSGSAAAPGATAKANLQVLESGTRVKLSVRGLHGSPDSVYELWCLRDDGAKVSAGTFRTDASGTADVSLTTAAVPGEYHRLGVEQRTLPPSGRPGVSVMAGEIQFPHS
jgi:anti-sigma factor RsiW